MVMTKQIKNMNNELHKLGIYTKEDLKKAIDELPPLDISLMVSPIPGVTKKEIEIESEGPGYVIKRKKQQ